MKYRLIGQFNSLLTTTMMETKVVAIRVKLQVTGRPGLTRVSTLASGKTGGKGGYKGHTGWWPPERHVENAATNVTAQACFPITCRTSMHQKNTLTAKH